MDIEKIAEKAEEYLEEHKGEDVTMILSGKGSEERELSLEGENRGTIKVVMETFKESVDEERVDWAVLLATSYMKKSSKEEEKPTDLASDPESIEVQIVQIYTGEEKLFRIYDKDTLEIMNESEEIEGFLSF